MSNTDIEIQVSDPTAPAPDSPPVAKTLTVDIWALAALGAFSLLMAYDNYHTGMGWAEDGPQPGYFPFYLSMILLGASVFGIIKSVRERRVATDPEIFVTRDQLKRVMLVFGPTVAFVFGIQTLGLYVSSFLLTAGFMIFVGKISVWKSVLTALIFSCAMFYIFEVQFDVIMPKGPLEALLGY
ncbi:tripartite tricarboxylate transporter TctB family protein [Afipia carboxidovorans]|nr:tripartite tricarboxylate transporter TctB family protein [Afipia carboxidovorans]BEV46888.1 tripartite tricarboxylate transporter TctB family protein [Afipia carboxidovorans]